MPFRVERRKPYNLGSETQGHFYRARIDPAASPIQRDGREDLEVREAVLERAARMMHF